MTIFKKGYADDVGIDICLDFDVEFQPFETKIIDCGVSIPSQLGLATMMCARTSAAMQGIIVDQCPIDPNYCGNIHIIAHNVSNSSILFKAGQAFAQLYRFEVQPININYEIKKSTSRNENGFGSTDKENDDVNNC